MFHQLKAHGNSSQIYQLTSKPQMKRYQMNLIKKIILSALVTFFVANQSNAMQPNTQTNIDFQQQLQKQKDDIDRAPTIDAKLHVIQATTIKIIDAIRASNLNLDMALFFIAKQEKYANLVPVLVMAGANVNARNTRFCTPLHFAAQAKTQLSVKALIHAGAHVRAQDIFENTPLHYVSNNDEPNPDASKKNLQITYDLINAGADINAQNKRKETPLLLASKNRKLILVRYFLKLRNINVNIPDGRMETPVLLAVKNIDYFMVDVLTEHPDIDINIPNASRETPMKVAQNLASLPGIPFFIRQIITSLEKCAQRRAPTK